MKGIRGKTPEARKEARLKLRNERRVAFHAARIRAARNGRERLEAALNYAFAVGAHLDDHGRTKLARKICALSDEVNQL